MTFSKIKKYTSRIQINAKNKQINTPYPPNTSKSKNKQHASPQKHPPKTKYNTHDPIKKHDLQKRKNTTPTKKKTPGGVFVQRLGGFFSATPFIYHASAKKNETQKTNQKTTFPRKGRAVYTLCSYAVASKVKISSKSMSKGLR